jgi:hypothetical protein
MAERERLLDPTGDSDRAVDTTLSPRLRSLRGLTARRSARDRPGGVRAGLSRRARRQRAELSGDRESSSAWVS